ncbi:MAG: hypothetical protein WCV58_03255 [Patescibacteria group bacterium]
MKKINIYLILGIIAFIGLIIFILFSFGVIKTNRATKTAFNEIKIKEKVFFPHLSQDNKSLYYFGDQGVKFKKFDFSTQKTENLYPNDVLYINDVLWSPDESKIIIKNTQPYTNTSTQLLNLKDRKITDLNKNIQSVIWSDDNQNIYYQYQDMEKNLNYLASAKYDGSNEQKVIDLDLDNYSFAWLDNFQKIGFWRPPSDISGVGLKQVDLKTKNISDIFTDNRLNKILAAPNGSHFIYNHFYEKDNLYKLSLSKSDGTEDKNLDLETSINKIAWAPDSSFLIAAVPEKTDQNNTFYKIDVKNNKKTTLEYSIEKNQDIIKAENLIISSDNKTLYFISNDLLYSLQFL